MFKNVTVIGRCLVVILFVATAQAAQQTAIKIPAFELPESALLGAETRAGLAKMRQDAKNRPNCPFGFRGTDAETVIALRNCVEKVKPASLKFIQERFDVKITPKTIAGVRVEVFEPGNGVAAENKNRVLINLHGGAFVMGAKYGGQFESIPVAAMGEMKVISVDYRQGPEHKFPAASEDVAAVYKTLLKEYHPDNIGIYGCSAGGKLTAQSLAWFQKERLPTPGAVGMFCSAAINYPEGDGWYFNMTRGDGPTPDFAKESPARHYFGTADWENPLLIPGRHDDVLKKFPPSLLLTSTRDQFLSDVVFTHSRLVKLGVEADLHVWEGLGHGGFLSPYIPEYDDAHNLIVRFFQKHLGQ